MMDTWKERGINTLVEAPEGHDVLQWAQEADAKGLYQIRHPSSDLHGDINDPQLLAWSTWDEPSDTTIGVLDYGSVRQDPAQVTQEAAPWRAAAQAEGKFLPVWTNHIASHIYPDWAQTNVLMHDYMEGTESDWLSADSYPIQGGQAFVMPSNDGYTSTTQGITLDREAAWSGGKPVMSFIGTSAFTDTSAQPTPGQFNAMAWSSVIHGATGITYFPVDLQPFAFDATPADVVRAMILFDQEIASIDKVLMNETSGGRDPFTVFRSANEGTAPASGQLPYPFEATEIQTEQGPYRIILNLSDHDEVLNKPEWGLNNVTFHAYEVHKGYAESSNVPTPEPTPTADPTLPPESTPVADPAPTPEPTFEPAPPPGPPAPPTAEAPAFAWFDFAGSSEEETIAGNDLDNMIWGGGGNDAIYGDAGADTLAGGAGADQLIGGSGDDRFVLERGAVEGDVSDDFTRGDVLELQGYSAQSLLSKVSADGWV